MARMLTRASKLLAIRGRVLRFLLISLFAILIAGPASCCCPNAGRLAGKPPAETGITAEPSRQATPTLARLAPTEPALNSEDAQVIPVLDAYNSAHQAGNAEEAFAHLATLDVVLAYESGYSGYYFHGFSSPEELALAIEKSVGEHGRLSTWRVDEISYSYQERQGGGYHLVFADVWRTYDDGYVGKFVFLLVKHEGRYLIIGMDETSY